MHGFVPPGRRPRDLLETAIAGTAQLAFNKKVRVKTIPRDDYSLLYHRLRLSRNTIPLLMCTGVIAFELFEHGATPFGWTPVVDVLVFGIIGPGVTFLLLNWLLHRVKERDEAEARLAVVSAHERELLSQLERSVRAERSGLVPTLESILLAVGAETSMTGGALYLLNRSDGTLQPAVASWPSPETGMLLADAAQRRLSEGNGGHLDGADTDRTAGPSDQRVITVPVADRGETLGILALSGPASSAAPGARVLGVVAGAMALLIHNNQLYAQLQSQAVIEERSELAREVHDGLAQSLGFLSFKAQHVRRLLDRGDIQAASIAVDELCDGSREAYEEVRLLIRSLRASTGVVGGLVSSIQSYSAMLAKRTGLEIRVDADADPSLSPLVQLQLFRAMQEALINAHKHAMARHVLIRLEERPDCVILTVEDDGLGLPSGNTGRSGVQQDAGSSSRLETSGSEEHLGLRIMSERLQSVGGEVHIESRPDEGTIVQFQVPAGYGHVQPGGPDNES